MGVAFCGRHRYRCRNRSIVLGAWVGGGAWEIFLGWLLLLLVQLLSYIWLFVTPWTAAWQASLSLSPRVCSNSCPLSWWCHPTISSSVTPFSSCLQSFPASESFPVSQLFALGGQSIEVSSSASILPVDIQSWFPSGWTGLISLQSKGHSRVFSSITIWRHLQW